MWTAVAGTALFHATAPSASAEPWRFLVFGDSRGNSSSNQVNVAILSELARATTNEHPAFVLVPGDLVYSGNASAFALWTNTMAPVYQAGIPVYPVIGNHDDDDVAAFVNTFGPQIPDNGPTGEVNRTYSFTHSNVLVLALDTYANPSRVNQPWIDGVLASNSMPHVFAFGHQPAFKLSHADTLDDYPSSRDAFWNSLRGAGARIYFCGHDHFFDHCRLDDGDGNETNDVHQHIVGTAGAPFRSDNVYNGSNGAWTPQRVYHERQYGYVVVEIGRLNVTATWKHRVAADTFAATTDVLAYYRAPRRAVLELAALSETNAVLRVSGLTPSASNAVDRAEDPVAGGWRPVHAFSGLGAAHEWTTAAYSNRAFFRVRSW